MKYLILLFLVGCAYGDELSPKTYGHTKGPIDNEDAGISDWGTDDSNDVPLGCVLEYAIIDGVMQSWVFCPSNPTERWKDIPDPDPFKTISK